MPDLRAEEQYRQMAEEARAQAASESRPYEKRRLLLSAQHYEIMAERVKRAVEARRARTQKSA